MKILVTGGAGFIGFNLTKKLLEQGHRVVSVDNFSLVDERYIKPFFDNKNFEFHKGDVKDEDFVMKVSEGCDVIYHLASIVGVEETINNPMTTIQNIDSTRVVIKAALKNNSRLVFASSADVYGKLNKVPLNENDDNLLAAPQINRWVYSRVKAIEETLCKSTPRLNWAVIRYFNSYGPGMDVLKPRRAMPQFIYRLLRNEPLQIYGDGEQTRSMCYITDHVDGTILVAEKGGNEIYNVGNDQEVKIKDLAQFVLKTCEKLNIPHKGFVFVPIKEHYGEDFEDIQRRVPGLTKIKSLGFTPKVNLEDGLEKTLRYYFIESDKNEHLSKQD